tara:strand:- start:81 stop:686 length:606 start_codon:yes stop_codon:yes gene_type:complete
MIKILNFIKKVVLLTTLFTISTNLYSQKCSELQVHMLPQNSFTEITFTTNYNHLVNQNTNAIAATYDWRAYPPGNHNLSNNTHFWHSSVTSPTFSCNFNFNDSYYFFILTLTMGDAATSSIPLTTCILPFFIARDTLLPSYWNLTMLNSNTTNIKSIETKERKLINTYNLAGQIVDPNKVNQEIVIFKYSDGSTEKKFLNR